MELLLVVVCAKVRSQGQVYIELFLVVCLEAVYY